jgi:hypothetical protein
MMRYKLFEDFFTLTEDLNCDIVSDRCDGGSYGQPHLYTRPVWVWYGVTRFGVCSGLPNNFYLF